MAEYGDVYILGNHRLMCGDSTNQSDVKKLVGNSKIDMIFTDPPYGVDYHSHRKTDKFYKTRIKNDRLDNLDMAHFVEAIKAVMDYINAPIIYLWCNWKVIEIWKTITDFNACIVWAKNQFTLGTGYRHQHEFCLFHGRIDEEIKCESDLWLAKKDHKYKHPTQKPVELSYRALCNHKNANNVLDLFGGSGSTLIGCEHAGRNAFVMEYDPNYVDLIIKRWEKMTGNKAVKEAENGC